MKITKEELNSFKTVYKKVYDETLTDDQAYNMASQLLRLSKILLKPPDHFD